MEELAPTASASARRDTPESSAQNPYAWTRAETEVDASVQTAALASTDSRGTTAKRITGLVRATPAHVELCA
jgi:hypothetical protein